MERLFQFPLKQHIGAKAAPAIVKGDKVARGQLIAFRNKDSLGANIYSSVSGVVESITEDMIAVRADEKQEASWQKLTGTSALELIEEAGIVGLGGAGFPTWAKLSPPLGAGGTVIINAAECEPILTHNILAIEHDPAGLIRGLQIAMDVTEVPTGIIAIKEVHEKAVTLLRQELAKEQIPESRIRIAPLANLYPMGEERAIIRETLGVLLPPDSLPRDAGAVVINAETAFRIREAVEERKPLIDKDLTVAGKLKGNDVLIHPLFNVPIGISVADVFEMAGGISPDCGELIMGGPFTGKRTELSAPVVKTTGGLIAAECFPSVHENMGLLVCACGADRARLEQIAESMGAHVVGAQACKQACPVKAALKCENPGKCPGQVQKVLALKKAGATALLISNCTDCTNTVMSCAPQLGLKVYHCTDGALRAVNEKLIRKIHS